MKKILFFLMVLAILASIGFGIWRNMYYFSNTFEVRYLFFRALAVGGLVGAAFGWAFNRNAPKTDGVERFQRVAAPIILLGLAFPIWAIWSNQALADPKIGVKKLNFIRQESKLTSRVGMMRGTKVLQTDQNLVVEGKGDLFYTYFIDETGKEDRVRSDAPLFGQSQAGAPIELPVVKGFWGFEVFK